MKNDFLLLPGVSPEYNVPRMPDDEDDLQAEWLRTSAIAFEAMLIAIGQAQSYIRLETYICTDCELSRRFRSALIAARQRGVRVAVMIDAFGSLLLPDSFWQPLIDAGGVFKRFNPLSLNRLAYRNHRKLLTCDGVVAFIGGFNLSEEYDGDGVTSGWRDLGMVLRGGIVAELSRSFDLLAGKASMRHELWQRLRRGGSETIARGRRWQLLLNIPSFHRRMIKQTLVNDLQNVRQVRIIAAYFLPTWRIRRQLLRIARQGGKVQLILAGHSDVRLAQLASHRVYGAFLRAGVEIYEYQPQILHAKMVILDDVAYAGSANLDLRSLNFNYELMVRIADPKLAAEAREIFEADLARSRKIDRVEWGRSRSWWMRIKERVAHFLLARIDPFVAHWQLRQLR